MQHVCIVCLDSAKLKCARCLTVYYCSGEHQRANWPQHKKDCASLNPQERDELVRQLRADYADWHVPRAELDPELALAQLGAHPTSGQKDSFIEACAMQAVFLAARLRMSLAQSLNARIATNGVLHEVLISQYYYFVLRVARRAGLYIKVMEVICSQQLNHPLDSLCDKYGMTVPLPLSLAEGHRLYCDIPLPENAKYFMAPRNWFLNQKEMNALLQSLESGIAEEVIVGNIVLPKASEHGASSLNFTAVQVSQQPATLTYLRYMKDAYPVGFGADLIEALGKMTG